MHVIDGSFEYGYGPDRRPAGAYVTPLEQARFDATAPSPDRRYHYRYVAVDEAVRAASLLPPRSQAYAAVPSLYRQYVAHGAVGPFATGFGVACPSPDLAAAARLRWTLPLRRADGPVRRHPLPAVAGAALLLVLAAAALRLARRRAGA